MDNIDLTQMYIILLFMMLILLYCSCIKKIMEKNDYKYGYYIISLEKKNIFYVFKKKGGKYSFRIIGEILINKLRYYEKEEPGLEMQIESLDINIKEKFFEYLKKENKDLVVLFNINIYKI